MRIAMKTLLIIAAAALVSCSKDDEVSQKISVDAAEKQLSFNETYQIAAKSASALTYTSENEYHASVSATGLVSALFVGETNITLSNAADTKKVKVVVTPKSRLYPTPNLEFGISKSALIAKLGKPDKEVAGGIAYNGGTTASPLVMYVFDANGQLTVAGVAVSTVYSSELGAYLLERYLLIDKESRVFVNALEPQKVSMVVGASLYDTSMWLVSYKSYSYQPNSSVLKSSSKSSVFDELMGRFKR